ncbi:patatin-like phospholipase family protein [Legionella sp. W05-934-2]|uniref:patatin-like phospholipase family protein n=1 Tax=Legionella sp. W05-934-2 TaxID=1198649 RepID=UPI0034628DEE
MNTNQNTSQQTDEIRSKTPTKLLPKETWLTTDTIQITFDPNNFSLFVTEQPLLPYRIAFSGGGARVPAHIGAYEELLKRGLRFTEFSGSSAGALVATLAYLGYRCEEIFEIVSWFDEDKLLDKPLEISVNNIAQILHKGGISSAKSLHQAANYVILDKVVKILSNEKYKHRFADHQAFLKEHVYESPTCITFETLAKIKEICPECDIGENLIIIGTNLSSKNAEFFSSTTTPKRGIADAIIISANLPVAFEQIRLEGKIYRDGGLEINFPVHCFSKNSGHDVFLKHLQGVDYRVIGLQFDNGREENALYSQKPVHQWSWFGRTFYSFVTGHAKTTDNWQKDLEELRKHAHQSILIKTPDLALSKLTLNDQVHNMVVESGRNAARQYLDNHGYYIDELNTLQRNEWLYETFQKPEALLEYCFEQKNFAMISNIQQAIAKSQFLGKGYKGYLIELCDEMLSSNLNPDAHHLPLEPLNALVENNHCNEKEEKKEIPYPMTFFAQAPEHKLVVMEKTGDLKVQLFTKLYPIFMQNWQKLCPISGIGEILNSIRIPLLTVEKAHQCVNLLVDKLKGVNAGHFLVFIFKSALKHYEESNFDSFFKHLKYLQKSIHLIKQKQLYSEDSHFGKWEFDEKDSKAIVKSLKANDFSSLNRLLETKKENLSRNTL